MLVQHIGLPERGRCLKDTGAMTDCQDFPLLSPFTLEMYTALNPKLPRNT